MTAIAVVSAPWGVLMAADGRMMLDDASRATAPASVLSRETDNAQKIFRIIDPRRVIAYALAGAVTSEDHPRFDLRTEFQCHASALSTQDFHSAYEYTNALVQLVAEGITAARYFPTSQGFERGLDGYPEGGRPIANAIFGGHFASSDFIIKATFFHDYQVARAQLEQRHDNYISGSSTIYNIMYDHRGNPKPNTALAKYIVDLPEHPSPEEAERFTVGYIEACCSPQGRELDPDGCKGIGGHIQVAKVTPADGFEWVIQPN